MKKLSLILLILFLGNNIYVDLFAQNRDSTSDETVSSIQKEYEFLKEQTKKYQEFVEKERAEHRKFLEDLYTKIVWFFSVVVAIVAGFITFLQIKNRKDISKLIDRSQKEASIKVEKLFKEHSLKIIDEKNKDIIISVDDLKKLLDYETNYRNKSILFLSSEADRKNFESRELPVIDSRGMKNHQLMSNIDEAIPFIKNDTFDVLVYYYNPPVENPKETGDKNLQKILNMLLLRRSKTPLIIYTYEKGERNQLYPIDMKLAVTYNYAVLANFPITMVNLLHTVANYFPVN